MANLLREFFEMCEGGVCQDFLTEAEKSFVREGGMMLTGMMQHADKENGNGRIYPRAILEREVDKYNQLVSENRALGELDHPDSSIINLKNVSHVVTKCWWDGNRVMGKIKILSTPSGQILKSLVESGIKLGISSRGLGSTKNNGGTIIVQDDFNLICFDMVSEPSTPGAFMAPREGGIGGLQESIKKADKYNRLMLDILRK